MNALPDSPYKGLNAFEDSDLDALLFFGRERECEIVVANLIASRLTVLYGPSGVGKSSLLRAAVARSLRALPEQPLVVVFSRWSEEPAAALAETIAEAVGGERNGSAVAVLEKAQSERDVYLVLDQAEEYFLYHADDAGPGSFAEALPEVLGAPLRVNVLVSLREDSLAKLDRFTGRIPGLFANTLRLDRLDRQAGRAAIVGPLERFGGLTGRPIEIEPELVERVLDEVGAGQIEPALGGLGTVESDDAGARIEAPYLQLVMERLWDEERVTSSDTLRAPTLDRLGGSQHIVEEHLEGAMAELTSDQKDVAARLFNHLVTPSRTKIAHEVSDLVHFGQVPEDELRPVLAILTERRILRSLEEGSEVRYEIFHDVLALPVLAWRTRHRTEREVERQLAEAHRRRSRLQRLLAIGLISLAVVVAVATFAVVQRGNANDRSRDARARQLDASAVALLSEDPQLSLLLASRSARLSSGSIAEDALRQSLLASQERREFTTSAPVEQVRFSPDGRLLAFAGADGRATVRDVASGRRIVALHVGEGGGVSFAPDSRSVLVHGGAVPPREYQLDTGKPGCALEARGRPVADAAIAGDYAVVVRNGVGTIWDRRTCKLRRTIADVGRTAVRVVVSPNGRRTAFVSGRQARVVDVRSGRPLFALEHPGRITALAFSAAGNRLVTGGLDRLARVWDAETGALVREFRGHRGEVLDVAIAEGGGVIATASTDGTGRLWDVDAGTVRAVLFGHTNFVRHVDFSRDGQTIVTASSDGTARTWAANGRPVAVLAGHTGGILDARLSPGGFQVATGGEDGTVRVWDAGTRAELVPRSGPAPAPAQRAAQSPDGLVRASVSGKIVRLVRSDGTESDLVGHTRAVNSIAFSPDSGRLVTAGNDSDAILWDVATGNRLRVLRRHFGPVHDARFSPDGRWIVTAGPRSIGLWKASTGVLVRLLRGPEGPFTAVAFLSDSRTIVAVSEGKVVSAYACRICGGVPELLTLADERLHATGRQLTPEERELYLG